MKCRSSWLHVSRFFFKTTNRVSGNLGKRCEWEGHLICTYNGELKASLITCLFETTNSLSGNLDKRCEWTMNDSQYWRYHLVYSSWWKTASSSLAGIAFMQRALVETWRSCMRDGYGFFCVALLHNSKEWRVVLKWAYWSIMAVVFWVPFAVTPASCCADMKCRRVFSLQCHAMAECVPFISMAAVATEWNQTDADKMTQDTVFRKGICEILSSNLLRWM